MKPTPDLDCMPRVSSDIDSCIQFVARQPWGRPDLRKREIYLAFERICAAPLARPVVKWVSGGAIGFRRYHARQFVIVYAFFEPSVDDPNGRVSIRAVRHRRERDVLLGVREKGESGDRPVLQTRDAPVVEASRGE